MSQRRNPTPVDRAFEDVRKEYLRACRLFRRFHCTHEGYAVILEEMDALWEEIKANSAPCVLREEAVQIAAMAVRFMVDCCEKEVVKALETKRSKESRE